MSSQYQKQKRKWKQQGKEEAIREIWWAFREAIHNGHVQIKIEDGKAEAFEPNKLKNSRCYVCEIIHKIETSVAKIFGDQYYTCEKCADEGEEINEKKQ